jgi:integrase
VEIIEHDGRPATCVRGSRSSYFWRRTVNLEDAVALYLIDRQQVQSPETWSKHRMTLTSFVAHFGFDPPELGCITSDDVRKWVDGKPNASPQSKNKYVDRVRSFFRYAKQRGWCGSNPCDDVDRLREDPPQRRRYSATTLGRALAATKNSRDRAAVAVALELLLRGSEIAELRVGDVDIDNLTVKVKVSKKDGPLTWDEMAISPDLGDELDGWLRDYRLLAPGVEAEDYLFPRHQRVLAGGEYRLIPQPSSRLGSPWRIVQRALRSAGVSEKGLGFHTIRRSAARILFDHLCEARGEVNALSHVSAVLHHENRRTTEVYLGVDGDRLNRNKVVREGDASVLKLARAEPAEPDLPDSSGVVTRLVPRSSGSVTTRNREAR